MFLWLSWGGGISDDYLMFLCMYFYFFWFHFRSVNVDRRRDEIMDRVA